MSIQLKPIGTISTPYMTLQECPNNIQHDGPLCTLELYEEYQDGLSGLKVGQAILILYWFEGVDRKKIIQESFDGKSRAGTFAIRSPHRPNPIAVAVLPIKSIDKGSISVIGLDCLHGTKLLDIKPTIIHEVD